MRSNEKHHETARRRTRAGIGTSVERVAIGLIAMVAISVTPVSADQVTFTLGDTDVDNWTTSNVAFDDTVQSGHALNWENVTTNTATVDSPNNEWDMQFVAGAPTNYTIGHLFMLNETFDLGSTAAGLEAFDWTADFDASGFANWNPVVAITSGGSTTYYRWNTSGNSWSGNGALDFSDPGAPGGDTFDLSQLGNGTGAGVGNTVIWGELNDTGTTFGATRDNGTNPNLQATSGTFSVGFIQWGASTSGSANSTFTTALDAFDAQITVDLPDTIIRYDADIAIKDPVDQGWSGFDLGSPNVVGHVVDGGVNAWEIDDNSGSSTPRYSYTLDADNFQDMYDRGWVFSFTVKVTDGSEFVGWGLTADNDPGWGLATRERVGFTVGLENGDADFFITPIGGTKVTLSGEGDVFHEIVVKGAAGASMFEWFLDGVSQGFLDIKDGTSNSSFDNVINWTSGSSGATDRAALWNFVELKLIPTPAALPAGLVLIGLAATRRRRK